MGAMKAFGQNSKTTRGFYYSMAGIIFGGALGYAVVGARYGGWWRREGIGAFSSTASVERGLVPATGLLQNQILDIVLDGESP